MRRQPFTEVKLDEGRMNAILDKASGVVHLFIWFFLLFLFGLQHSFRDWPTRLAFQRPPTRNARCLAGSKKECG